MPKIFWYFLDRVVKNAPPPSNITGIEKIIIIPSIKFIDESVNQDYYFLQ